MGTITISCASPVLSFSENCTVDQSTDNDLSLLRDLKCCDPIFSLFDCVLAEAKDSFQISCEDWHIASSDKVLPALYARAKAVFLKTYPDLILQIKSSTDEVLRLIPLSDVFNMWIKERADKGDSYILDRDYTEVLFSAMTAFINKGQWRCGYLDSKSKQNSLKDSDYIPVLWFGLDGMHPDHIWSITTSECQIPALSGNEVNWELLLSKHDYWMVCFAEGECGLCSPDVKPLFDKCPIYIDDGCVDEESLIQYLNNNLRDY